MIRFLPQGRRQRLAARHQAGAGFTLIELLVAIAIFTSLSSFLVIKYRDNEQIRTLKNQAQEAVAGLEKVQNMALVGETVDSQTPARYRFSLQDCAADCVYGLSAVFADESEAAIAQGKLTAVAVRTQPSGGLNVEFFPPRGKMTITTLSGNLDSAAFEISNSQAAYCVKLNAVAGRIDLISGPCS